MKKTLLLKSASRSGKPHHLSDYDRQYSGFSIDDVKKELSGLPGNAGLNIAHEAVDRHAEGIAMDRTAIRWVGRDGETVELTYRQLKDRTSRFANALKDLGVKKGDVVCVQSKRIPALYICALGTLKYGAVFCPLFPAFGPDPVFQRLMKSNARVLVTSQKLYRSRVAPYLDRLPGLKHILLTDAEKNGDERLLSFEKLLSKADSRHEILPTRPDDPALLHFTSGTTGMPKGAIHVHESVLNHYLTGKYVLDFHDDDVFWCTADPGWVTGTSYGIISPLAHGLTNIVDTEDFDAGRWMDILQNHGVTIWYTAPTAIRRLMRLEGDFFEKYDLGRLRLIFSVGEPLNPDAVLWACKTLGLPVHDTWWQTETGAIMIANFPGVDIRPGAMGKPVPGIRAAVMRKTEKGAPEFVTEAGVQGELALKAGWPSMFRGYLDEPERYRKCFTDGWYLTGDLACLDEDGFFHFVGRNDDIIKTAGHMVGPFEVESVLAAHPAVAESAVVGKPDTVIGEIVKAFVCLKPGFKPDDDLRLELLGFARKRLGAASAPREIEFIGKLPKNNAGKILRRSLKGI